MRAHPIRLLTPVLLGLSLVACDQSNTPGTPDAAVSSGPYLKVTYRGADHSVDLSKLAPVVADAGTRSVKLSDVVLSALPGKDLATFTVGFRASDGFDPSTKSTCAGVFPFSGDKLSKGYVDLGTLNLTWAAELQLPGCIHVKSLAQILLTDAGAGGDARADRAADRAADRGADRSVTDARPADLAVGTQVKITYKSADTIVDISLVTKQTPDAGAAYVLLSDVVLKALPGKDLSTLTAQLKGADGYDPSTKTNCNGFLPVAGEKLSKGYLAVSTLVLTWDASLSFPGCLKVTGLAQVLLADK
jgi:hypothetical protein